MTAPLCVGLAGLGTVGRAVVHELLDNADALAARAGRRLDLTRVVSRTPRPEVDRGGAPFDTDLGTLTTGDAVDVIVETIAGEDADAALGAARGLYEAAVAAGRHLVTATKALIALHGKPLLPAAEKAGVRVGFEASVAGGIPILNALTHGLAANRIEWLAGIVNGTSNYILTAMTERQGDFDTALAEAQRKGYAEADPSFDIEGTDAAYKLAILAGLAFDVPFDFESVHTEGISTVDVEDIEYARELGYRIKHLGIASFSEAGVRARVHPCLVPENALIAKVDGVMNAVQVSGHAVGSTLYLGPGAGGAPTASAIVADLVDIARQERPGHRELRAVRGGGAPMDALRSAHYLKIPAVDEPGVFAHVAEALSREGISIEGAIQRARAIRSGEGAQWVPIVILTNVVAEAEVRRATEAIEALDGVSGAIRRIRVADFGGAA